MELPHNKTAIILLDTIAKYKKANPGNGLLLLELFTNDVPKTSKYSHCSWLLSELYSNTLLLKTPHILFIEHRKKPTVILQKNSSLLTCFHSVGRFYACYCRNKVINITQLWKGVLGSKFPS